jgi:hypothetical protein
MPLSDDPNRPEALVCDEIMDLLNVMGCDHQVALGALLGAYRGIALQHRCCTPVSAAECSRVAAELMYSALRGAPANAGAAAGGELKAPHH